MKNHIISKSHLFGFIFVSVLGSAMHFIYPLCGNSALAAIFCPINESIWEHLKLLYFPCLFWTLIEYFALGYKEPIFLWGRSCSVIIGLLFIVMFYYTYTGSIGCGCLFVDISLFFASSALTFALSNFICSGFQSPTKAETLLMTGAAALIGILLVMFTFSPPHIPLFRDPINGSFGIVDTYNTK